MKFSAIFCIALTISCAVAVKTNTQSAVTSQTAMNALKRTGWGEVALSFMELNEKVGGVGEELFVAFASLYQDLKFKKDLTESDHQIQLAEHVRWENGIQARINSAVSDIAQTTHRIDVVLVPRQAALELAIATNEALIVTSNQNIGVANADRAAQQVAYEAFVDETSAAIDAINECLDLLAGFEGSSQNLVQITKAKNSFKKVQKALTKTKFGSMMKALLKLADFTNTATLHKLEAKFNEVASSLNDSLGQAGLVNQGQIASHEQYIGVQEEAITQAQAHIVADTQSLNETIQEIADARDFLATRQNDLAIAQEELQDETDRWAAVVVIYDDFMVSIDDEIQAIWDVVDLFKE